jgi:hypothetical protein
VTAVILSEAKDLLYGWKILRSLRMTNSQRDVVRRRLANQYLTTPGLPKGSDVVHALGAVQAQDYPGAKWALSQRTSGPGRTDAEIERELTDGKILRTHVLRPTWHFVSPADIRWMLALTAPRVKAFMAYYNRSLGLTPAVFKRSHATIARALEGGRQLTRQELRSILARARVGEVSGQRLGHLMMEAELDAVVCSGAMRGKQFTYALLDERVPPTPAKPRDEALAELTKRYFAGRGPASVQDFSWWSGLTVADVKRGIQLAGDALEPVAVGDRKLWLSAQARPLPTVKATAHLLPNYDEYFIGFKDRSAIGERLRSVKAVTGGNALMQHVVAVDGQIVGGWKRIVEKKTVVLQLQLLTTITSLEKRNVAAAAERFSAFLGARVALRGLG